ncbi:hypothetical protein T4B_594 [Trichinella pseudospiralis]|uniref:Uncharacterized protein n=1 Tax=Trichinella pseudospiralis TaxID=6337 RepID=A0A0V1J8P6_TRIPS|nr:hypothetical protein T4B_594 [Trichinella pseudospiralis]
MPHHVLSFTMLINVEKTDRIPGGAYVLFCSCGCSNLPDDCWHAMNVPKQYLTGQKLLPLKIL